jgi:D-beta-D-heptose 7-phosphate kinase/D-beta-D-heptose 1-phosphate adenosyltransferase|tara:strand:- start:31 stop:441 length:411 start_codon:yes stop_codon:yes gene_type:complete
MKKIFVNGAFDVVHSGHLDLLDFARGLGTHLLVAIDTDRRIEYNKGKERPFNKLKNRKHLISSLKSVTSVVTFDTDNDLLAILQRYKPDVMVKGSDWRGKEIIGEEYCKEVVFYERVNKESSTKILKSFVDRRQLL